MVTGTEGAAFSISFDATPRGPTLLLSLMSLPLLLLLPPPRTLSCLSLASPPVPGAPSLAPHTFLLSPPPPLFAVAASLLRSVVVVVPLLPRLERAAAPNQYS